MHLLTASALDGILNVFHTPYRERLKSDSEKTCRCLRRSELICADRRIPENSQHAHRRHGFLEKLELFAPQLGNIQKQSGKVAARTRETLDPSASNWVGYYIDADNGNGARCIPHNPDCIWGCSQNNVALEGHKIAGEFVNPADFAPVKPRLQEDILAVHISGFAQTLDECLKVLVLKILNGANSRKFSRRLLCACRERPRRRAAKQRDELAAFQPINLHMFPRKGLRRIAGYPFRGGQSAGDAPVGHPDCVCTPAFLKRS